MSLNIAYFAIWILQFLTKNHFHKGGRRGRCKPDSVSSPKEGRLPSVCATRTRNFITPKSSGSFPIWSCCGRSLPRQRGSRPRPAGSYPAISPLPPETFRRCRRPFPGAVYFLLHWSSRGLSSAVSFLSKGLPAPCSPDFPQRKSCRPPGRKVPQAGPLPPEDCFPRGSPRSQHPLYT